MKIEKANKIVKLLWKRAKLGHIKFRWGNMSRGFGYYQYRGNGKETIVMSKPLTELNSQRVFQDALLHEVAHALVGPYNNHNKIWQRMAKRIGCTGTRCYPNSVTLPRGKYRFKCPKCKHIINFYRKPTWLGKKRPACGNCCNKYNKGLYSTKYVIERFK